MESMHLTFRVEKCVNSSHNDNFCHPPDIIEAFVEDVSITGWILQQNAELEAITENSSFVSMTTYVSTYLGSRQFDRNIISLA